MNFCLAIVSDSFAVVVPLTRFHLSTAVVPEPTVRLRFIGFRGDSVPYWSSLSFFVGAALFTEGSFYWMAVGADAAPPSSPKAC